MTHQGGPRSGHWGLCCGETSLRVVTTGLLTKRWLAVGSLRDPMLHHFEPIPGLWSAKSDIVVGVAARECFHPRSVATRVEGMRTQTC